ncbi:hypothetical protein GGR57DRAFT_459026 [Xylariaceae sp. FL1272]|nr:hypothetical protein GGR57DRAFT_459026 [Xylariaceae sp. FL1272]
MTSMSEELDNQAVARVAQACNQCRQRKGRCNGKRPCDFCERHSIECCYESKQKRRGPGKSKEYIRLLESRLRNTTRGQEKGHIRQPISQVGSATGSEQFKGSQNSLESQMLCSSIPTENVVGLLEPTLGRLNTRYPFLSMPLLMTELATLDPTTNVAWCALFDSVIALAMLFPNPNPSIAVCIEAARTMFKGTHAQLPRILSSEPDILVIEALLALTLLAKLLSEAQIAAQLISVTARLLQITVLQRNPSHTMPLESIDDRHRRAFWTAYILDMEICSQCGLPPAIDDEEFGVVAQRPQMRGSLQGLSNFLQLRVEAVVLASIIHKRLYRRKAIELSYKQLIPNIIEIDWGLGYWPLTVAPVPIPDIEDSAAAIQKDDDFGVLVMHLEFYNCVGMASWAARRYDMGADAVVSNVVENSRVMSALRKCRKTARATLGLLEALHGRSFIELWDIMGYLLSAVLILFLGILEDPVSLNARSDLQAVASFRDFLKTAIRDGCDFQRLLQSCLQIEQLAQLAIDEGQALVSADYREATAIETNDEDTRMKIQTIRDALASCVYPMYVAHGLLTSSGNRDSATASILDEVLFVTKTEDRRFGLLTPACLRDMQSEGSSDSFAYALQ